jgi:hypothetical protein
MLLIRELEEVRRDRFANGRQRLSPSWRLAPEMCTFVNFWTRGAKLDAGNPLWPIWPGALQYLAAINPQDYTLAGPTPEFKRWNFVLHAFGR